MWSKRTADIRPTTVLFYSIVLLLLGYVRVLFGHELDGSFHAFSDVFTAPAWLKWLFPVFLVASSIVLNWMLVEWLQILKRNSYLGFLWGLALLSTGRVELVLWATAVAFWFGLAVRVQRSKRLLADVYDMALYTGLLTFLDFRFIALLPIGWILLAAFARLRWRAIFVSIWGIVTMHILGYLIALLTGGAEDYFNRFDWTIESMEFPQGEELYVLSLVIFWWILSLKEYIIALSRANIVKRQSLSALLAMTLGASALWVSGLWPLYVAIAVLPVGMLVLIVNDVQYRKKFWWRDVLFWSFLLAFATAFFY